MPFLLILNGADNSDESNWVGGNSMLSHAADTTDHVLPGIPSAKCSKTGVVVDLVQLKPLPSQSTQRVQRVDPKSLAGVLRNQGRYILCAFDATAKSL